jgi:hypothetical protein
VDGQTPEEVCSALKTGIVERITLKKGVQALE